MGGSNSGKYFGYKLTSGDEFALIVCDSRKDPQCILPGHDVLEMLLYRIHDNCDVTVSIGYTKLIDDDLRMSDDLFERANDHLKQAKLNGKNQIYFGQKNINTDDGKEDELKLDDQDDEIQQKSLQDIKVSVLSRFFLLVLHYSMTARRRRTKV